LVLFAMAMVWVRSATGPMTTHFWGPVANWGLVASAAYDAGFKGPEIISLPMTGTMIVYSSLFMRFAWCVQPRNMILLACHSFNVLAQGNQLRRALEYKLEKDPGAMDEIKTLGIQAATATSIVASSLVARKPVMNAALAGPSFTKKIAEMPAGPFYIHFWAPSSKWMLSVSNLMDLNRPVENISLAQTLSLTATGVVWSRWSMVINPINYNLMTVNIALGCTSGYHLFRKLKADYYGD